MAELFGSYIASVTIDISPWIPCGLAMGSVILCLLLLLFMPDLRKPAIDLRSPKLGDEGETSDPVDGTADRSVTLLLRALSDANTLLIIPVFLVGIFRYTTLNILIQYASVRFGMKISTGATFYTETALVNIALFLFIIPPLTSYIRKGYNIRPQAVDLFLVRSSVCLMCVGCVCIGLARSSKILPIGKPKHPSDSSPHTGKYELTIRRGSHLCSWIWQ
jgi:hypothetical protein